MNRRWNDEHPYRIARPDQVGYTFDEPYPVTHDIDADVNLVDPGLADLAHPIDPRDFIRPDGSYDVTPINLGDASHVEAVNEFKRRLRDATPCPIPYPNREGESL